MKRFLSVLALMIISVASFAHGTQVAYCVLSNGFIRVYIEHWHGAYGNAANIQGSTINVTTTYGTTTINQNISASGIADNTTVNNLPGCTSNITVISGCPGEANIYNNWGYWDFAPAVCGVPVSITINGGNDVVFDEACGQLYPATVNATFNDNAAPVIVCPVANVQSCSPVAVNFAATVTDACDPNPTVTYSIAPGSVFNPGSTAVTVTATDNQNQTSSCTFNVVVGPPDADGDGYSATTAACGTQNDCDDNDATVYPGAPELCDGKDNDCNGIVPATETDDDGDGISECQGDCDDANAAINATAAEIMGNNIDDNCDGLIDVLPYCVPTNSYPYCLMYITAVSLGTINNTSGCSSVAYSDYSSMSTALTPGNTYSISVSNGGSYEQAAYVFVDWNNDGDFTDAGEQVTSMYIPNIGSGSGSFVVPATASGSFRLRVISDYYYNSPYGPCYTYYGEAEDYTIVTGPVCQAPTISCHSMTVSNDPGLCSAAVSFHAHATGTTPVITYSVPSGTVFPVGVSTVIATATNSCGTASCNLTVTVNDTENPTISCPSALTVSCSGDVPAPAPGTVAASDNCGTANVTWEGDVITNQTCANRYTITRTYKATDASNNSTSCTQTITVDDQTAPVISSAPANIAVSCASEVPVADNNIVTASDNCGGAVTVTNNDVVTSGSCANRYIIARTYTATDVCGNSSSHTQTITVDDQTAPVITCPANATVSCTADNTSAATGTATATDNCNGAVTIAESDVITAGNCAGNYNIARTWTATDICGNTSSCTQTITVQDTEAPIALCKNVEVTLVNGSATITAALVNSGSSDNCSGIASMTVSKTSFDCSDIGANSVTFTVTDACGNSSTCTSTVTVIGEIPTCNVTATPSETTYTGGVVTNMYLGYGSQSATLNANAAGGTPFGYVWSGSGSAYLNCTSCANPVFTPTAPGTYIVTATVTNANGCVTSCSITFCVKDIREVKKGQHTGKVNVCHIPPGNPSNANTITVSTNAVPAHLAHGDQLGSCNQLCGASARTVEEVSVVEEVKVYPNPNQGTFTVEIPHSDATTEIKVTDVQGKLIGTRTAGHDDGTRIKIDLVNVASGLYFVEVLQGEQRFRTRIIVQ